MGMRANLKLLRVAALVGIAAAVVGAQAAGVGLAQAALDFAPHMRGAVSESRERGHTPVTLCHATASATNPYVVITTDDDGVLGAPHSSGNGHDSHGGDIIPPFGYTDNKGDAQSYAGKNWDAGGQAIFANDCEPASPPCPDASRMTGGHNGDDGCEPPPPCPDELSMTGGDNGDDGDGCEPPPCPDDLSMIGGDGDGDNDNGDDGCEPPPCPESLSMTGGDNGDDGDGCEPPPPCPDELGMTGGHDGDNGDDGCEPPPCPESLSMTGGHDNDKGDDGDGCEPPPCPDDLSMTGGHDGDNGDDGCEPPPCPEDSRSSLTTGGGGDSGDDECEEEKTKLVVKKIVVNDDGGTATPDDFSFQVNGGPAQSFESDGRNALEVDPGTYTVTEPGAQGYATTYDNCAQVVIPKGETETCTITNDDEQAPPEHGRVIVEKVMNGGTDTFEFTGTPAGFISVDGGTISADVAPGQYTSTELVTAGWNLGSIGCDDENSSGSISQRTATFNVEEGETVTCTFRNRKRSMVIVEKVMVGGSDTFEFAGTPAGSISESGGTISADVSPGTHTATEASKAGWALTSITCDDANSTGDVAARTATFRASPGEIVTCTFTNEKRVGSIIVQKQTDPDGHPQSFAFEASYDEGGFSLSDGEQDDSGELLPGMYSVSESVPASWDLTAATCSDGSDPSEIELSAGENVTCVFTNTLQRGSIIVQKQTDPDGHPQSFAFEASYDEGGFSLSDGEQNDSGELLPGTYSVSENVPAGWILTSATCSDESDPGEIELSAGENVTCVFENALVPLLGRGAIDVQKSATPTSVKEPGGLVTFSVTIKNVSVVNVAIENVVDDKFGDLDDEGGNGCFDAPINLLPLESVNCTFQREITGAGGTSHVNTVGASGHDAFGNPVFDSDDARVDITPRLIDLVIVKEASSPTPLNGVVNYSLTVTNKGPDTATNVQLADPAPAGITYLTANPSQGTCNLGPSLVTCALGTIAPGQTVTIAITARATAVGSHTNTATVTGTGGRETNPADNSDSAVTVVPAPPTTKPPVTPPPPVSEPCLALTVSPKMIKADGQADRVTVHVTAGKRRMKGVKVTLRGAGIERTGTSNGKGLVVLRINPRKAGIITITAREANQKVCGPKRIGVVGVFLPPVTG